VIERQLDVLTPRVPRARWAPWPIAAAALGVGLLMSRVPLLRLVSVSARTVQAAVAAAGTVAAVDRFVADRRRSAA
jgi:hypothetical protein